MRTIEELSQMAIVISLLSGCSGLVKSHITVFHDFPMQTPSTKYAFLTFETQKGSVEHENYKKKIREELFALGHEEVPSDQADVLFSFVYGVGEGIEKRMTLPE